MNRLRHVIIGNSAAGINAATAIRKADPSAEITMLSAENCMAYSPVVLPYLVSGRISEKNMYITDQSFYDRHHIDLKPATPAQGIDIDKQQVILHNGSRLDYDRLLIATGASARKLSLNTHAFADRIFSLRTMADARAIVAASQGISHALIAGAGLVGLETAYAFQKKGISVTIIAKSDQLLSRNADAGCAGMIQKIIEQNGVKFLFGHDTAEIENISQSGTVSKDKGKLQVVTDMGEEFSTDIIVVGKGVDANLAVAKDTGIEIEWGIRVNTAMQTSVPNIYAAGDVAQSRHLLTGEYDTFSNWPSACKQGNIAGSNMAGTPLKLAGEVAYNVMPVFDLTAAFMERRDDGDDDTEVYKYIDDQRSIYRKILVKNDRVVGAVMLGAYKDAGVMLNLLKKRKNVARIKETLASGRAIHASAFIKT